MGGSTVDDWRMPYEKPEKAGYYVCKVFSKLTKKYRSRTIYWHEDYQEWRCKEHEMIAMWIQPMQQPNLL